EDLASYYEQNKNRFGQPERRRASHIMIEVPAGASDDARKAARAKAEDLAKQAAADPAQFAELARKNSQDAGSAANGGDLGWLAPGFVADKASALIRSLPKAMSRNYVPAPDFGRAFYEAFPQPSADAITGELARFLSRATGATV
ncbi:DUF3418 domain-containing protein, partial [Salmonella enterica]|nr:DUF3418 domain-containing protein [Salmonella enterica]